MIQLNDETMFWTIPQFVTPVEVAEMLRVSPQIVYLLAREKELLAIRIRGSVRIAASSVVELVRKNAINGVDIQIPTEPGLGRKRKRGRPRVQRKPEDVKQ